jgi:hypothetical protein
MILSPVLAFNDMLTDAILWDELGNPLLELGKDLEQLEAMQNTVIADYASENELLTKDNEDLRRKSPFRDKLTWALCGLLSGSVLTFILTLLY